ncbi:FecCD family ABC transporter permease [Alicyclobacillus fodiniaquatilis]|jgi:iron complex transport system permease protein|uniref:FecCD family ABC transporter permease n=1 Tax=Alicyclobacillus fodiniaquatilis TaxID=1661150 RepID=A0ABW4JFV0_9BACL
MAEEKRKSHPVVASGIIFCGLIALLLGLALSVSVGAADIHLSTVWASVFHFNPKLSQDQVIHYLRLPRAVAGALVGAAFAVAGALMQGMTRNPLADPGILGVNAGSEFLLAVCFAFIPGLPFLDLMLFSFLGAGIGMGLVYGIGSLSKGGLTPVRLALAGAAVAALLVALSQGIALYFGLSQDLAFWYAGGMSGTTWLQVELLLPWVIGGLIGALLISRSITLLSLGEDVATSLGQRTGLVKLAGTLLVLILAGAAVSVVGPVGFVGLVIPHIARYLVGVDYRWIIPCSAVLGSLLMVFADIGARMIHPPYETPIGALIALIGVPFFLYLSRKKMREL